MHVYAGATLKAEKKTQPQQQAEKASQPQACPPPDRRRNCGSSGGKTGCLARGCCYDDAHGSDWCSSFTPAPAPTPDRHINAAFATLAPMKDAVNMVNITIASPITRLIYPSYFATDVEGGMPIDQLVANVIAELAAAVAAGDDLFAEHVEAVEAERSSRVEVKGDVQLARLVNVTQVRDSHSVSIGPYKY